MENPLLKKLLIKPQYKVRVLNAPDNFNAIIGEIPETISFAFNESTTFDALFIFAITKADMLQALDLTAKQIDDKMICWIMYPKAKTMLASDLNLMQSWEELKSYQLAPCASAAIDSVWTSLRIKPESASKKSGLGNAEIKSNDYGEFIDVENKIVTLPADLKAALEKQPTSLQQYEKLSYSNRKEYVLWILSAKQEKTKLERLEKTVEKLLAGKKNPNEK